MRGNRGFPPGMSTAGMPVNGDLGRLLKEHRLFVDDGGVVRVPHLIRGRLVPPPDVPRARVVAAVNAAGPDAGYVRMDGDGAQVLVERYVEKGQVTERRRYLLLPDIDPLELVDFDLDQLVTGPYAVPFDEVLALLDRLGEVLIGSPDAIAEVVETMRATAPYPDAMLDTELTGFAAAVDTSVLRTVVDRELGAYGRPGSEFLDGWVTLPGEALPEPFAPLSAEVAGRLGVPHHRDEPAPYAVRAMPTRQLHITAGNAPLVPALSALRLLVTKGAGVVKLPSQAVLPTALLATALSVAGGRRHPLLTHLSVGYWPGGDPGVEAALFAPDAFDRIVVWGDVAAVASVRQRAPFTRVVSFDPRYGVSILDVSGASASALADVAARAAADVCLHDQKACDSSHLQYVLGSRDEVQRYADALSEALATWDATAPPVPLPGQAGHLMRLRRGRLAGARWRPDPLDSPAGATPASTVVVSEAAFDVLDHPFARFAVIRPVPTVQDATAALSRHVATVGVWPEALRLSIRDPAAARGVAHVVPLGRSEHALPGAPHDGMLVLSQLVEWVSG